jgi:hypothetical protein
MLTTSPLPPPAKPPYLIRRGIYVVHKFGALGAVNSAIVALQHPLVLLIGASSQRVPVRRLEVGTSADLAHNGAHHESAPSIELATNMFGYGPPQRRDRGRQICFKIR